MPIKKGRTALDPRRRLLLQRAFVGAGVLAVGPLLWGFNGGSPRATGRSFSAEDIGSLQPEDVNGVRLPRGLHSRVVAITGAPVTPESDYLWHPYPDGGATFAAADGGWIYVSNSESRPGGAGALRFAADGKILDAYSILSGTELNCAGGPTPWGTWLSCEEHRNGNVYECDPTGRAPPMRRPAMGSFVHEGAAVDPQQQFIYLTEDVSDGGLYRFKPDNYPDLSAGQLEIAQVFGRDPMQTRKVEWHPVPQPNPKARFSRPTRKQCKQASAFNGGEGIWFHRGMVYFTTKGDNRVWAYDCTASTIELIYDDDLFEHPILTGVDNIIVSAGGDLLVAEDGGDMQLVVITPQRQILPLLQVAHRGSEIAGPAFSPDGNKLYFSSQRGPSINGHRGITYEISGPLFNASTRAAASVASRSNDLPD